MLYLEGVKNQRSHPARVQCLMGKFVEDVVAGGTFAVVICDDNKFQPVPDMPNNQTLDVMVPKGVRYKEFTAKRTPDRYENAIRAFWERVTGDKTAVESMMNALPVALEQAVKTRSLAKRGASNLRIGSKVRVWMTDVYALGTIIGRDLEGYEKNSFEVKWVREDWDPEVVELQSDDETLDETNEARWQNLWFLDEN